MSSTQPDDPINAIFEKLCGYKYSEHNAYIDCNSIKKRLHDYLEMKPDEDEIDRKLGSAVRSIVRNKKLRDVGFQTISAEERARIVDNLIRGE